MNRLGKALLCSTPVLLVGYGAYKLAQKNKNSENATVEQRAQEFMNRLYLTNPVFNPLGAGYHLFHPNSKAGDSPFDSPIVKYVVDKNSSNSAQVLEKIPPNLTREERIEYFKQRGGTGLTVDKNA